ncbi:hypothetical protein [Rhodococcoides fascians]|uniref:hypothetical protein n=1 Tax=Rhodococcoides fascians TaxID=1828 RepID=UPI000560C079|nr:hypothetical protein [Rhodococcus fascians]
MIDPDIGIDDRINIARQPFALGTGWDWTVTIGDNTRRFPDHATARGYAREATRILHNNDKAGQP